MTYEHKVVQKLEEYLRSIREEVVSRSGSVSVEYKDDNSVVTHLDRKIERDVTSIILSFDKNVGIYGEEFGTQGSQKTFWTIDPIDGTEHFMRGTPEYMFMAGFIKDNKPTASILYNFELDRMFVALPGQIATMNGQQISVSSRSIDKSCVEIETNKKNIEKRSELIEKIDSVAKYSKLPAWRAGYGLSLVAIGSIEARIQFYPDGKLYDFLPGFILIKAAGGEVVNVGHDTWDWKNMDTIASNGLISNDLQKIMNELTDSLNG